jgi:rsbT co-antagonist protein RsbR
MTEKIIPQAMGSGWSGEVQMKHSDGSIIDTYQTMFPVPDAEGNLANSVIFVRDITERKQARAELEAFAQRLALLVEQTPLAVIEWDLDFRVTRWNPAAERIFGYTREQAIGHSPTEFIVPESAQEHTNQVWKTLIEEKRVVLSTNENITKSGEIIVCEWTNAPLIDANGEIIGVVSTAQDVTEREKAEKELQEQQALLHQVIDSFPGFVFVKDREGRFTLANRALAEHYKTDVKAMIGKTDADFNPHPEEVERFLRGDRQVMESLQEKFIPEEIITDRAGQVRWLQTSKRPLLDTNGVATRILGVCSDITARKQAEEEREHLQREIIETQQVALQELSTPVIPVLDTPQGGIIVLPLIGNIDSMRAQNITRALLAGIRQHQAAVVVLDITGVSIVDSGVANHLNKTIRAARLKGAQAIITGISEAVAETIVDLGIDWSGIDTLSDLQTGLVVALHSMGLTLSPIRSSE